MRMGFGQISPSASSTRDLETRLWYLHMWRYHIFTCEDIVSFLSICYHSLYDWLLCNKKRYYTQNNNKSQAMLWQWRKKNPDLVRAQKWRYFERKVWPRVPRTQQRKDQDGNEYDPNEILWDFFGVCVVLTYLRKRVPRSWQRKEKDGDECNPDEILQDLFGVSVVLTHFRKSLPLPLPPPSRQRSRKRLAFSFSSSDSETDEALSKELDLMLAKPEEPVERRMEEIRKTGRRQRQIESDVC